MDQSQYSTLLDVLAVLPPSEGRAAERGRAMDQPTDRYGLWAVIGGGMLLVRAGLLGAGHPTGQPLFESLGNLLMTLAGIASIGLPLGLRAARIVPHTVLALAGTIAWGLGTALHSLADLPAIVDPTNRALSDAVRCQGWCCSRSGFWPGLRPSSGSGA
jgi:hypothetical protein